MGGLIYRHYGFRSQDSANGVGLHYRLWKWRFNTHANPNTLICARDTGVVDVKDPRIENKVKFGDWMLVWRGCLFYFLAFLGIWQLHGFSNLYIAYLSTLKVAGLSTNTELMTTQMKGEASFWSAKLGISKDLSFHGYLWEYWWMWDPWRLLIWVLKWRASPYSFERSWVFCWC